MIYKRKDPELKNNICLRCGHRSEICYHRTSNAGKHHELISDSEHEGPKTAKKVEDESTKIQNITNKHQNYVGRRFIDHVNRRRDSKKISASSQMFASRYGLDQGVFIFRMNKRI